MLAPFSMIRYSVIIPFAYSDSRIKCLKKVLEYYTTYTKNIEIIVVEEGSISDLSCFDNIVHIKIPKKSSCFNKNGCINAGYKASSGTWLLISDCDTIPSCLDPIKCFDLESEGSGGFFGGNSFVKMLDMNCLEIPISYLIKTYQQMNRRVYGLVHSRKAHAGGLVAIRRDIFRIMGGADEDWNFEQCGSDVDLATRAACVCSLVNLKFGKIKDFPILHYPHAVLKRPVIQTNLDPFIDSDASRERCVLNVICKEWLEPCEPVTAVLLNWKRHENFPAIIGNLYAYPFFKEIIVWNNSTVKSFVEGWPLVKVENSLRNVGTYGRLLAMSQAKHKIIYTQDDDYVVLNILQMYLRFKLSNMSKIVHSLSPFHWLKEVDSPRRPYANLGWGSFMLTEWKSFIDYYIKAYGEDDLLISKSDRIWTTICNRILNGHIPVPMNAPEFPTAMSPDIAIHKRHNHNELVKEAVDRSIGLDLGKHGQI